MLSISTIANSSTLMTWLSFFARAVNNFILLPFILKKFPPNEIAVWLLFLLILNIISLADLGFSQSFSRAISFAYGGGERLEGTLSFGSKKEGSKLYVNKNLIVQLISIMNRVYLILSIVAFAIISLFGTYSVSNTINSSSSTTENWYAWAFLVLSIPILVYGIKYSTILLGINKIAEMKRWETMFIIASIITSIILILLDSSIFIFLINNLAWLLIGVLRNKMLAKKSILKLDLPLLGSGNSKIIFKSIWGASWKSAVGMLFSYGLIQSTGLIYPHLSNNSTEIASYLLSLRIMMIIIDFSRAPFYTKLPTLSILLARNNKLELIRVAQKGIILSLCSYTFGVILTGISGNVILMLMGSQTPLVSHELWACMSLAFFFERYSSIHIQLYSISNDIIWHIVNAISGTILLFITVIGYKYLKAFSFPISILISNLCWSSFFCARHSYRYLNLQFPTFEIKTSIPPLLFLIAYAIYSFKSYIVLLN